MKDDVVTLKVVTHEQNDSGFNVEVTLKSLDVMADVKSARRAEYYAAAREGIEVRYMMVLNLPDWEAATYSDDDGRKTNPSMVVYDGTPYNIVRSYRTDKQEIELTLTEAE